MKKLFIVFIICLIVIPSYGSSGLLDNDPFLLGKGSPVWSRGGESLLYKISFLGIPAGYAEFVYMGMETEEGKQLHHIRMKVWTTGLVNIFKEVKDEFHYYIDAETLFPFKMRVKQRESRKKVDKVVYYDQDTGVMSHFSLQGKKLKEYKGVPGIFEPVTLAFYLRTLDLSSDPGNVKLYGGKRVYTVRVKALGKEKVKTDIGVFDTLKVRPEISNKGKPSKKGDVTAWLINDGSNIPLLVHAKLKFGALTGNLIQMSRGKRNE